jgi:hypothetical protein
MAVRCAADERGLRCRDQLTALAPAAAAQRALPAVLQIAQRQLRLLRAVLRACTSLFRRCSSTDASCSWGYWLLAHSALPALGSAPCAGPAGSTHLFVSTLTTLLCSFCCVSESCAVVEANVHLQAFWRDLTLADLCGWKRAAGLSAA